MSNEPRESKKTTKEKAAAARAAAEAEQRKRDRRVRVIGGVAIAVVMGRSSASASGARVRARRTTPTDPGGIVADAALPTGVFGADSDQRLGRPVQHGRGQADAGDLGGLPVPGLRVVGGPGGAALEKLATDGKVNLVWRPTTFLDANFPASPNPNSSRARDGRLGLRDRRRQDRRVPQHRLREPARRPRATAGATSS